MTSASRRAKPLPRVKPTPRRDPRLPPARPRKPPRRDPHPSRPRPKVRPKSPRVPVKPWVLPKDPIAGVPGGTAKWRKFARRFPIARLMRNNWLIGAGMFTAALVAGKFQQAPDLTGGGFTLCCDIGGPYQTFRSTTTNNPNPCGAFTACGTGGQVFTNDWPCPIPETVAGQGQVIYIGQKTTGGIRSTHRQVWSRPAVPGKGWPGIPAVPYWIPVIGFPWPLVEPWDVRRPSNKPSPDVKPRARPRPRNQPRPDPYPSRPPVSRVEVPQLHVPAIEVGPEGVSLTRHERRPPDDRERERKRRLTNTQSNGWMKALGFVGTYTELDDFVAALYKSLPMKYRRWRGRDGVWRDRDHTTALRAKRLFEYIGKANIKQAVDFVIEGTKNVIKEELQDRLFGAIGNAGKKSAKERGEEGLWNSIQSPGQISQMAKGNAWWERRKQVEREAFEAWWKAGAAVARPLPEGKGAQARTYWDRVQDKNGNWGWVRKERGRTEIPWYRKTARHNGYVHNQEDWEYPYYAP